MRNYKSIVYNIKKIQIIFFVLLNINLVFGSFYIKKYNDIGPLLQTPVYNQKSYCIINQTGLYNIETNYTRYATYLDIGHSGGIFGMNNALSYNNTLLSVYYGTGTTEFDNNYSFQIITNLMNRLKYSPFPGYYHPIGCAGEGCNPMGCIPFDTPCTDNAIAFDPNAIVGTNVILYGYQTDPSGVNLFVGQSQPMLYYWDTTNKHGINQGRFEFVSVYTGQSPGAFNTFFYQDSTDTVSTTTKAGTIATINFYNEPCIDDWNPPVTHSVYPNINAGNTNHVADILNNGITITIQEPYTDQAQFAYQNNINDFSNYQINNNNIDNQWGIDDNSFEVVITYVLEGGLLYTGTFNSSTDTNGYFSSIGDNTWNLNRRMMQFYIPGNNLPAYRLGSPITVHRTAKDKSQPQQNNQITGNQMIDTIYQYNGTQGHNGNRYTFNTFVIEGPNYTFEPTNYNNNYYVQGDSISSIQIDSIDSIDFGIHPILGFDSWDPNGISGGSLKVEIRTFDGEKGVPNSWTSFGTPSCYIIYDSNSFVESEGNYALDVTTSGNCILDRGMLIRYDIYDVYNNNGEYVNGKTIWMKTQDRTAEPTISSSTINITNGGNIEVFVLSGKDILNINNIYYNLSGVDFVSLTSTTDFDNIKTFSGFDVLGLNIEDIDGGIGKRIYGTINTNGLNLPQTLEIPFVVTNVEGVSREGKFKFIISEYTNNPGYAQFVNGDRFLFIIDNEIYGNTTSTTNSRGDNITGRIGYNNMFDPDQINVDLSDSNMGDIFTGIFITNNGDNVTISGNITVDGLFGSTNIRNFNIPIEIYQDGDLLLSTKIFFEVRGRAISTINKSYELGDNINITYGPYSTLPIYDLQYDTKGAPGIKIDIELNNEIDLLSIISNNPTNGAISGYAITNSYSTRLTSTGIISNSYGRIEKRLININVNKYINNIGEGVFLNGQNFYFIIESGSITSNSRGNTNNGILGYDKFIDEIYLDLSQNLDENLENPFTGLFVMSNNNKTAIIVGNITVNGLFTGEKSYKIPYRLQNNGNEILSGNINFKVQGRGIRKIERNFGVFENVMFEISPNSMDLGFNLYGADMGNIVTSINTNILGISSTTIAPDTIILSGDIRVINDSMLGQKFSSENIISNQFGEIQKDIIDFRVTQYSNNPGIAYFINGDDFRFEIGRDFDLGFSTVGDNSRGANVPQKTGKLTYPTHTFGDNFGINIENNTSNNYSGINLFFDIGNNYGIITGNITVDSLFQGQEYFELPIRIHREGLTIINTKIKFYVSGRGINNINLSVQEGDYFVFDIGPLGYLGMNYNYDLKSGPLGSIQTPYIGNISLLGQNNDIIRSLQGTINNNSSSITIPVIISNSFGQIEQTNINLLVQSYENNVGRTAFINGDPFMFLISSGNNGLITTSVDYSRGYNKSSEIGKLIYENNKYNTGDFDIQIDVGNYVSGLEINRIGNHTAIISGYITIDGLFETNQVQEISIPVSLYNGSSNPFLETNIDFSVRGRGIDTIYKTGFNGQNMLYNIGKNYSTNDFLHKINVINNIGFGRNTQSKMGYDLFEQDGQIYLESINTNIIKGISIDGNNNSSYRTISGRPTIDSTQNVSSYNIPIIINNNFGDIQKTNLQIDLLENIISSTGYFFNGESINIIIDNGISTNTNRNTNTTGYIGYNLFGAGFGNITVDADNILSTSGDMIIQGLNTTYLNGGQKVIINGNISIDKLYNGSRTYKIPIKINNEFGEIINSHIDIVVNAISTFDTNINIRNGGIIYFNTGLKTANTNNYRLEFSNNFPLGGNTIDINVIGNNYIVDGPITIDGFINVIPENLWLDVIFSNNMADIYKQRINISLERYRQENTIAIVNNTPLNIKIMSGDGNTSNTIYYELMGVEFDQINIDLTNKNSTLLDYPYDGLSISGDYDTKEIISQPTFYVVGISTGRVYTIPYSVSNIYGRVLMGIINIELSPSCEDNFGCIDKIYIYSGNNIAQAEYNSSNYVNNDNFWYDNRYINIQGGNPHIEKIDNTKSILYCDELGGNNLTINTSYQYYNKQENYSGILLNISGVNAILSDNKIIVIVPITGNIVYDPIIYDNNNTIRTKNDVTVYINLTGARITNDNGWDMSIGFGENYTNYTQYNKLFTGNNPGYDLYYENLYLKDILEGYTGSIFFKVEAIDKNPPSLEVSQKIIYAPDLGINLTLTGILTGFDYFTNNTSDDDVFVITSISQSDIRQTNYTIPDGIYYDILGNISNYKLTNTGIVADKNRSGWIHFQDKAGWTGSLFVDILLPQEYEFKTKTQNRYHGLFGETLNYATNGYIFVYNSGKQELITSGWVNVDHNGIGKFISNQVLSGYYDIDFQGISMHIHSIKGVLINNNIETIKLYKDASRTNGYPIIGDTIKYNLEYRNNSTNNIDGYDIIMNTSFGLYEMYLMNKRIILNSGTHIDGSALYNYLPNSFVRSNLSNINSFGTGKISVSFELGNRNLSGIDLINSIQGVSFSTNNNEIEIISTDIEIENQAIVGDLPNGDNHRDACINLLDSAQITSIMFDNIANEDTNLFYAKTDLNGDGETNNTDFAIYIINQFRGDGCLGSPNTINK